MLTPSEVLSKIHSRFQRFPFQVIGQERRNATIEELIQLPVNSCRIQVFSVDYLIQVLSSEEDFGSSCKGFDAEELEKKCHQYLWASAATLVDKFSEWQTYSGRSEIVQQINDNCSLQKIEDILLGAYFLALSEEDPQDEWFTAEQQELRQRTMKEVLVPLKDQHVFVTLAELQEWYAAMDKFDAKDLQSVYRHQTALEAIAKKIAVASAC